MWTHTGSFKSLLVGLCLLVSFGLIFSVSPFLNGGYLDSAVEDRRKILRLWRYSSMFMRRRLRGFPLAPSFLHGFGPCVPCIPRVGEAAGIWTLWVYTKLCVVSDSFTLGQDPFLHVYLLTLTVSWKLITGTDLAPGLPAVGCLSRSLEALLTSPSPLARLQDTTSFS